jgi:site-specific recombinase XerD
MISSHSGSAARLWHFQSIGRMVKPDSSANRSSRCGQRARNVVLNSGSVFTLPQHNADKCSCVSNPSVREAVVQSSFRAGLFLFFMICTLKWVRRHSAATIALAAGVSPKVVSEQLGHASTAFTLDTYAHVLPHMLDEAAARVEAMLFRQTA